MTEQKRQCKDCEYYVTGGYGRPTCHFNPPTVSGDHQSGSFPKTSDTLFCSKWEPKWHENQILREAWEEFLMVHKLITCGEENDKT